MTSKTHFCHFCGRGDVRSEKVNAACKIKLPESYLPPITVRESRIRRFLASQSPELVFRIADVEIMIGEPYIYGDANVGVLFFEHRFAAGRGWP